MRKPRSPWLRVRIEKPDGSLYTNLAIPPRQERALRAVAARENVSLEEAVRVAFTEGLGPTGAARRVFDGEGPEK